MCLILLSWSTTCDPQAISAAPLTAHNSPTLELHIMKTLPRNLQTTSHAQAVAIPPPTTLSQKHCPWLTSVVGTELTCPAVHHLRWLLMYSELCNHHHYLIPKYFLCPQRNLQSLAVSPHCHSPSHPSMASPNLLPICMDLCYPGPILYLES